MRETNHLLAISCAIIWLSPKVHKSHNVLTRFAPGDGPTQPRGQGAARTALPPSGTPGRNSGLRHSRARSSPPGSKAPYNLGLVLGYYSQAHRSGARVLAAAPRVRAAPRGSRGPG